MTKNKKRERHDWRKERWYHDEKEASIVPGTRRHPISSAFPSRRL